MPPDHQKMLDYFEAIPIDKDFPILLNNIHIQNDAPIVQLHRHGSIEIGDCMSGTGLFNIQNTYVPFKKGDVVVISKNTIHFAQSKHGTKSTWHFAFFDIDTLMARFLPSTVKMDFTGIFHKKFGNVYSKDEFPRVNDLVRKTILELKRKEKFYELQVISNLLELTILINRNTEKMIPRFFPQEEENSTSIEQLNPAISHIQNNFSQTVHISELSGLCNMSNRTFLRHFKQVYDITPYEYLLELRLTMVCKDLKSTNRSINYISDSNGFGSLSSFNRQFKYKFGISPSMWRKLNKPIKVE